MDARKQREEEMGMKRNPRPFDTAALLLGALLVAGPALAQKPGSVLKIYHRDSPASMSILEEATNSTEIPMMGVFNNLVLYKQDVPQNSLQSIIPDLATDWTWNEDGSELTFRLRQGVSWHDGEDLGEHQVKNIARPVRVYRVRDAGAAKRPPAPAAAVLPLPDKPSIAVLPFANMSGDPEQEYFADGMVEEIITALSRIRWLFVIARNSSFTYKGQFVDVKRVGRELGVRYVLEDSVRKGGSRVRITAQLVEAESGAHLWADRFVLPR
jgi:TolB-like protein